MKKTAQITKQTLSKEETKIKERLENEFTIGNALTGNLLGSIVMFLALFMINAILLNKYEIVPQISFEEFVAIRVEAYEFQEYNAYSDNIIATLVGNMISLLMQIVLDALKYILIDVNKTQLYGVAAIVGAIDLGAIFLVYLLIFKKEVPIKILLISIVVGAAITMLVMNTLTFVIIALVTSPMLLGYFSYWVFLPSTTVAIPILLEWITGVNWIYFWYVFALILSTIVSITIFIANRIWNPVKRSEKLDKKLYDNRKSVEDLKDDHWLWIFIATVVGGLVTVVWKLTGKLVFTLFSKDSDFSFAGKKAELTDFQIIIFYVILITIGYFVAFMMSYTVYKRASGKKNWVELYKARHPSRREQFVRWFVYTSLLTFYWVYSMAIPSSFLYANEVMKGILVSMIITFTATIAGKLSTLKPR